MLSCKQSNKNKNTKSNISRHYLLEATCRKCTARPYQWALGFAPYGSSPLVCLADTYLSYPRQLKIRAHVQHGAISPHSAYQRHRCTPLHTVPIPKPISFLPSAPCIFTQKCWRVIVGTNALWQTKATSYRKKSKAIILLLL